MTIGATATQCGNAPSAASSSSWTLTSTNTISVGEVGILRVALDNISTVDGDNNEVVSVTGGSGTWSKLGEYTNSQGTAANGVTVGAWLFLPDDTNAIGTVFTITLASNRTQKVATIDKWTLDAGKSLRQTLEAPVVETQIDGASGFGTATYTGLTNTERLYLRSLAGEFSTTVSVTATTGFTSLPTFRSSTSSPVAVLGEFRVRTSTDETSNPSFTPVADKAGIFLALEEYNLEVLGVTATLEAESLAGLESEALGTVISVSATTSLLDKIESSSESQLLSTSFLNSTLQVLGLVANSNLSGLFGNYTGSLQGLSTSTYGSVRASGTLIATTKEDSATSLAKAVVRGTEAGTLTTTTGSSTSVAVSRSSSSPQLSSISLVGTVKAFASSQAAVEFSSIVLGGYAGQETELLLSSLVGELGSLSGSILLSSLATAATSAGLENLSLTSQASILTKSASNYTLGTVAALATVSTTTQSSIDYILSPTNGYGTANILANSVGAVTLSSVDLYATVINVFPILAYTTATLGSLTGVLIGRSGNIYPTIKLTVGPKSVKLLTAIKRFKFTVENTNMQTIPTKYPEEIWVCSLDLTNWIATSSVAAFEVEVLKGDVTVDQSSLVDSYTAQWRLSGGTARSTTVFRAIATMSDGQIFAKEFKVLIGG